MRWVLVLLLVAAVARAAPLQVEQAPVDLLHAQRVDITERFEIVRMELAPTGTTARASSPLEMTELMLPAHTAMSVGDWAYSVTLRERDAHGVPAGVFDVRLDLAGETLGTVRLVQGVDNPVLQEGATVVFGLGAALPASPLFVVSVREVPQGPVVELTSAINADFQYVWRDDAQAENPTVDIEVSDTVLFVLTNGDGTSPHNFRIIDGSDPPPTTPDMVDLGDEESLAWTPPSAGVFQYLCQYHPTMKGNIEVSE